MQGAPRLSSSCAPGFAWLKSIENNLLTGYYEKAVKSVENDNVGIP